MTNAEPAVLLVLNRSQDANIIATVDRIRAELPSLRERIPTSIQLNIAQYRRRALTNHPRLAGRGGIIIGHRRRVGDPGSVHFSTLWAVPH